MGATVRNGGTHFRVWAPTAEAVHVALVDPAVSPPASWQADGTNMLARDASGFWSGFFAGVGHDWEYRYWIKGPSGEGYKRDPRAAELALEHYPDCNCRIVKPRDYPWHDEAFVAPRFNDLIIYQFHIGVFFAERDGVDIRANRVSKFLDVVSNISLRLASTQYSLCRSRSGKARPAAATTIRISSRPRWTIAFHPQILVRTCRGSTRCCMRRAGPR
ncbi:MULTISPECIES: hypothetical protein [Bradyrhizobium]|uniref:hypothetical protein n=1 Tax=Bradyrhizobium TaxID=374 RepID=UPI002011B1EF|nr:MULTISPECIES: hypothetical protein [Bradyrhizobium]